MMKRINVSLWAAVCGILLPCAAAIAQSQLPPPEAPFQGKIGLTYKDSEAVKPKLKIPQNFGIKDAPNILIVLIDDCGFGQMSTFGGGIPTGATGRARWVIGR